LTSAEKTLPILTKKQGTILSYILLKVETKSMKRKKKVTNRYQQ